MRIILHLHTLPAENEPASHLFLREMMMEMARKHAEHSFIFLIANADIIDNLPDNVSAQPITFRYSKWLGKKFWSRYILPKKLAALKCDLFITVDYFYLKKTSIPACLFLIHQNSLLYQEKTPKKNKEVYNLFKEAITNASSVIMFSENDRLTLQTQLPALASKIKLLQPHVMKMDELKWTEKEMVKIDYAAGIEYFVFAGDLHERFDLVGLLKAYSLFKKWQQSNMKLLLVGNSTPWAINFVKKLTTFKYRSDVHLLFDQTGDIVQKIIGGAYAFVYPALYDHFPVNILLAMQAGVPVISAPVPVCNEWGGDALMYPETNDVAGFAKSLQLIYKDERLRTEYIAAAKKRFSHLQKNDMVKDCLNIFEESVAT